MRVALVGSAPSSARLAPYKDASYQKYMQGKTANSPRPQFLDESWEIWGCSPGAFGVVERATRWFEVHRWEPGREWFSPEYCQWLKNFKGPVYTGGAVADLPSHVVYPIAKVEEQFSAYFLTSSLALMMALAILEIEAKGEPDNVIGFWGVDMAATEEYGYQRAGCQFFILEALRRGIGVYVPPESDLLRPMPVYGISEWDHTYIKATARMRELNSRRQQHQAEVEQATKALMFISGACDDLDYFVKTWTSPYGVPSGQLVKMEPGTGLGGKVSVGDE